MLVANALDQPQVFIHRDYHSRNLMVTDERNPGILDFQDAVEGPFTYDLVSLLKDCYVRWPEDQVRKWARDFYTASGSSVQQQVDSDQFMRYFELMGVQRHLKAAGIFARLNHRDGKPVYMDDVPRTLGYIVELESQYEDLSFLTRLITERCLPALQENA
jgi:aminoglycoside/choline kinase family phosphotransferase